MFVKKSKTMVLLKLILSLVVMASLVIGTYLLTAKFIWEPKINDILADYDEQISELQATLDEIGPIETVYTLRAEVEAGKAIEDEDFEPKKAPVSFLTENYVLDPSEVAGQYYKIDISEGSPMIFELAMEDQIDKSGTVREVDINASFLPIGLKVGDYIDLRFTYPMGEDFLVLSHKRVQAVNENIVKIKMDEKEIHLYQAALVDYFLNKEKGAIIYMTQYLEPGVQEEAIVYYRVPNYILAVIKGDPNIENLAKVDEEMNIQQRKELIGPAIDKVTEEVAELIFKGREGVEKEITQGNTDFQETVDELEKKLSEQTMSEAEFDIGEGVVN